MGKEYFKRPVGVAGGVHLPSTSATLGSTAVTLSAGLNVITYDSSGAASDMILPSPHVGEILKVVMNNGTTSLEANVNTDATGNTFFGSTFNTITANSTANDSSAFELVGVSTSQWGIVSLSVNGTTGNTHMDWSLSATTGSTGQA